MTTKNRNLFVVRVHCLTSHGTNFASERFTETRVFPVGMTFAQMEAITTAELISTHTILRGVGWKPFTHCKVSITPRPSDDPKISLKNAKPLLNQKFKATIKPFWSLPSDSRPQDQFNPKTVAKMCEFARTTTW